MRVPEPRSLEHVQRVRAAEMGANQVDLVALTELIESGKASPVIDRTYTLVEVLDAIRDFQDGHPREACHQSVGRDHGYVGLGMSRTPRERILDGRGRLSARAGAAGSRARQRQVPVPRAPGSPGCGPRGAAAGLVLHACSRGVASAGKRKIAWPPHDEPWAWPERARICPSSGEITRKMGRSALTILNS